MTRYLHRVIAATFACSVGLGGSSLAIEWHGDTMPAPATGGELFPKAMVTDTGCVPVVAVATKLKADEMRVGGQTVVLVDGLQQAFSDAWRRQLDMDTVNVSSVVAHIFAHPSGGSVLVEVVEFGANECALSRTLLTGELWQTLLQSAAGIEV